MHDDRKFICVNITTVNPEGQPVEAAMAPQSYDAERDGVSAYQMHTGPSGSPSSDPNGQDMLGFYLTYLLSQQVTLLLSESDPRKAFAMQDRLLTDSW